MTEDDRHLRRFRQPCRQKFEQDQRPESAQDAAAP